MAVLEEELSLEPLARLSKDLKMAVIGLQPREVRYLVDIYYQIQDYRCQAGNQSRALNELGEPNMLVGWIFEQQYGLEKRIKAVLDEWSERQPLGRWAKSIRGIGPVIASGLLAHIDITKAPTVGHIWRYAGLDPTTKWYGKEEAKKLVTEALGRRTGEVSNADIAVIAMLAGRKVESILSLWPRGKDGKLKPRTAQNLISALAKRPWNHRLKVLCWKIGESFVKVKNHPDDIYGKIYEARKQYEIEKNEKGEYAEQAANILRTKEIDKDTVAYQYYKQGVLPPGHIHARAKRYAVKIFLSHYHYVAYRLHYGKEPPKPYVIEHLGHVDIIPVPNLEVIGLV